MINSWQVRETAIVEADDFCDRYDRNGLDMLFYWKTKYPDFKITLFTIPDRTSFKMLELIGKHKDWIELAVHGFNHESNFECYGWDYDRTNSLLERTEKTGAYRKIFKAPGWSITGGYNGYPPDEKSPIAKDPQCVYRALADRGYLVFDRHYNAPARVGGVVCVDCQDKIVHMHTWNMETGDKVSRNGFRQVEEEQGVPWDYHTEFYFVSEAREKGLFVGCSYGKN